MQFYSTMSETGAAIAERTTRSLKNVLYRYMEDHAYKYIHKFSQIITILISTMNFSIDFVPKNVRNSDILSVLYSKPLRDFRKPKFRIEDRVCISKCNLPFRKGYKPEFTQEIFVFVAISSKKTSSILKKRWTRWDYTWLISSKFLDQSHLAMVSFTIELVSNASAKLFPENKLSSFTNFLPEQLHLDGQWEVEIPEVSYSSRYQIVRKLKFFDERLSKTSKIYSLESCV